MPLPFNRLQMVSKHAPVWSVWEVSEVLHCVLIAEPLELCSGRRSNLSAQQKYFPVLNKFRQFIIVIRMLSSRPKRVMWQSYCAEDTQRTSQTHTNRDTHIHTHTHKLSPQTTNNVKVYVELAGVENQIKKFTKMPKTPTTTTTKKARENE